MLRAEAWTLPTSALFEKRFDIPVMMAGSSGLRQLSAYGDNTLIIPASWADADSLVTSTEGAWIRIYDDAVLIDEFMAKRVAKTPDRPTNRSVTGPQVNGLVEGCAVYPYGYPNNQSGEFDWHWGLDENLLTNPGAEDNPLGLANPGAEDGTRAPWNPGDVEGYSADLEVNGDAPRTGSFAWENTALLLQGGMSYVVNVYPGRIYSLGAWIRTVTGTHDWSLTAGNAAYGTLIPLVGTVIGEYPDEVTDRQTIGTTYTQFAISWQAGPDMDRIQINVRELGGVSFPVGVYVDDFSFTGFGIGIAPWEFNSGVVAFNASQDVAPSEGSWHFLVTANPDGGVFQGVRNVLPGETVTFQADMRGPVADTWSLELRDINGALIPGAQTFVALNTGAWGTVQATAVMPDFLPGDGTVQFWLVNRSLVASTLYFDNAKLFSGLPAATFTEIIRLLIEAAQARGTFTFVDLDFTDTQDTAGVAVTPISFSAFFGDSSNLSQPLSDGKSIGYNWRIIAKATPVGALTHDLQIWAPGSGPGDLTAVPGGPSVLGGGHLTDAELVTRIPAFTTLLAHGAGALLLEDTNAVTEAAMGRIERVADAEAIASLATLQEYADAQFEIEAMNRDALSAIVLGTDQTIPLVDYTEGNIIWWQFPGVQDKVAKAVERIGWTHGNPARYTLQGSTVFSTEGAQAAAIDHLLQELKRRRTMRRQAEGPGEGGLIVSGDLGAHLHLIGGSQSIAAAGEQITWDDYADQLNNPFRNFAPVTFPTTEIVIQQRGYYDFHIDGGWEVWEEGGSIWLVRTRGGTPATVWPVIPGVWESTAAQRFEDMVAPGIDCEPGDVYEVFIDHGDGSSQTLDVASVAAVLVDRTFAPPPIIPSGDLLVWTEDTAHDFGPEPILLSAVYIIGGGGGGGRGALGGGGGAGEAASLSNYLVSGVVSILVGDGGAGASSDGQGGDGDGSSFDGNAVIGGGGGGGGVGTLNGRTGGSGGGAGATNFTFGTGGAGTAGNDGGDGDAVGTNWSGGGGGGFSGDGQDGVGVDGGDGGPGLDLSSVTTSYGDSGFFAGGGGAAGSGAGQAGGGDGGEAGPVAATDALANSGSGGGGAYFDNPGGGGDGGKGIVIAVVA